jgi:hypothetical protein
MLLQNVPNGLLSSYRALANLIAAAEQACDTKSLKVPAISGATGMGVAEAEANSLIQNGKLVAGVRYDRIFASRGAPQASNLAADSP